MGLKIERKNEMNTIFRELKENHGLKNIELAKKLGVSKSTIHRLDTGAKNFSVEFLETALKEIYGINIDIFDLIESTIKYETYQAPGKVQELEEEIDTLKQDLDKLNEERKTFDDSVELYSKIINDLRNENGFQKVEIKNLQDKNKELTDRIMKLVDKIA